MVKVRKWRGRFGNQLFMYVYARLLAEQNGLQLCADLPAQDILKTTPPKSGAIIDDPICQVEDFKPMPTGQKCYIISEHHQTDIALYNKHREHIRSFFTFPPDTPDGPGPNDLVVSLRLGQDFSRNKAVIVPRWYRSIINNEKFEHMYILGADSTEPYLRAFAGLSYTLVNIDFIDNFHFIRRAKKLICSNSTYAWWAAFLGHAEPLYTLKPWTPGQIRRSRAQPTWNPSLIEGAKAIKGKFLRRYQSTTDYRSGRYIRLPT